MIPILFPENETQFIANGIGRLTDAVSCIVTEQRNGEYELEMEYPQNGIHAADIALGKIIYAKHSDKADYQPFVVYFVSKAQGGIFTVNAEHLSYRLTKEVVKPFTASSVGNALTGLSTNAIDCPFTFTTDKSTQAAFSLDHPETIRKVLGGMQGSVLDVYGGEYEWDKFGVKLWANRGTDGGVTLRNGKNITELLSESDAGGVYTACTPYWKNGDSVKYITGNPVVQGPHYSDYPYGLTISLDCTQLLASTDPNYVPTDTELTNCALNYMAAQNAHLAKESIDVSFVALWQTEEYKNIAPLERVNLCDWVTVIYDSLDINVKMKVTETVYNVLLERYDRITLGESTRTLAKTIDNSIAQQIAQETSSLAVSLDAMRAKMLGLHDSFKYEQPDADGNIIATYYMDTNDISTAQNVMRIDSAGIYFSQTGVNGTFTSAWAINGVFNAQFIQSGTMLADRILGGTLTLGGASNGYGTLVIKDANDDTIGSWTRNGISILKGSINGPSITLGGANNASGSVTVKDADGTTIATWNNSGLTLKKGTITGSSLTITYTVRRNKSDYSNADAQKVLEYIAGTTRLTDAEFEKYDLNLDGTIGTGDSTLIQQFVAGNFGNWIDLTTTFKINPSSGVRATISGTSANEQYSQSNTRGCHILGTGLAAGKNGRTRIGDSINTESLSAYSSVTVGSGGISSGGNVILSGGYFQTTKTINGIGYGIDIKPETFAATGNGATLKWTGNSVTLSCASGAMSAKYMYAQDFINTSDEKIKQDIVPLKSALDKVKKGEIYSYKIKSEAEENKKSAKTHFGMVIGDGYKVPEELIRTKEMEDEDGKVEQVKGIDLYAMCSMLWKAVQELSAEIDEMKK